MPWVPELSAPVLEVESSAGEPELYHPVRGRIKGRRAFDEHVAEMNAMLVRRNATVEEVGRTVLEGCGFEEVVGEYQRALAASDLDVDADPPLRPAM